MPALQGIRPNVLYFAYADLKEYHQKRQHQILETQWRFTFNAQGIDIYRRWSTPLVGTTFFPWSFLSKSHLTYFTVTQKLFNESSWIFRRHRYGVLPHKKGQSYYGYQPILFLWQHICNTLSNFLTYCSITQKLFHQSSSNFQGKAILSSPSLTIVLLLWVSTNVVSMATYLQYSIKFLIYFNVTYRLFDESSWNFQET